MKKDLNCWTVMQCKVYEECPAYQQDLGSRCFAVEGTLCRGQKQGCYREKIEQCRDGCKFYDMLIRGE